MLLYQNPGLYAYDEGENGNYFRGLRLRDYFVLKFRV